ncbi:O-antigen ligase family protein [Acetoanaerobium noterae]|uniref:O-antigen ligase family protein n=1 Tax=Acetoanaerobium noterae TaxID=745369 RepID=UPI0028AAB21F|nr:O-antigen ligase family protein [Acetoanaerobium noterae]
MLNKSNEKKVKKKETIIKNNNIASKGFLNELFKILPLILIVGFLPFVIRLKLVQLEGPFYEFWTGEKINADFFTYYKQIFIYIVAIWALLNTFLFTKKIKFTKAYYFMGAYVILVILSTLFSKYPQIALHGFNERKEGMWIVLCYLILMFATINLVETEKQIKAIIYSLGISGAVISIISIFQYFGMDIYNTEFAKNLMISKEIQAQIKEFSIEFGDKYSYGVFYNPNYLGGYISLYVPLMLSYVIISKNIKERVLFSVFFILSIFALYGSRSEAGVLGTVGAIGLLILVLKARYIIKDKPEEEYKKLLLTRFVPIILALIILPVSLSYISISENPLARIRTEAVKLFQPSDLKGKDYKEIGPINDIKQIDEQTIELKIDNEVTRINIDKNMNLKLIDENNNLLFKTKIEGEKQSSGQILSVSEYPCYINIINQGKNYYSIHYYYNNKTWEKLDFLVSNRKIYFTTPSFKILDIEKDLYAKHIGFEGKGSIGSNRGYIWSRSMPLVLENLIIGSGQDTFITEFPQYDIYGRQAEGMPQYYWNILTDKPHNTYLQIGIQSGLLSLIIVLAGLLILLYKSFKNVIFDDEYLDFNIISFGILGFMISSIFNDSIIAITPIVYIFIGINIVGLIKTKNKKADS